MILYRKNERNLELHVITKREKMQYAYVFLTDLLALAVSILLSWLITDGLFNVLVPYTARDWMQTLCTLALAFVATFFCFDQTENIVTRRPGAEIKLSLKFNLMLCVIYSALMLLTKATMLDSRYFAVTVPLINALLLPLAHGALKRLLLHFQRSWGMESLVGIVTTTDRADRLINEIGKDWSRRIVGVALLEATHEIVGTEIDGIAVKANFTDFMDWIRREALDEVYVDVPMDSGESFIPYLEEMESMGLTVHFCLPLLDRIEEACCDETSAARLSRTLGRCAGGSIVTMGTVELKLAGETIGMVNLIAGQDVSRSSLLYSFSKLQEFFGSLYLKVVLVVSAICAIIYVAWVLLNSPHTRHSSKKVHRYGRPRD